MWELRMIMLVAKASTLSSKTGVTIPSALIWEED